MMLPEELVPMNILLLLRQDWRDVKDLLAPNRFLSLLLDNRKVKTAIP